MFKIPLVENMDVNEETWTEAVKGHGLSISFSEGTVQHFYLLQV